MIAWNLDSCTDVLYVSLEISILTWSLETWSLMLTYSGGAGDLSGARDKYKVILGSVRRFVLILESPQH